MPRARAGCERIPALVEAGIKDMIDGPFTFGPNCNPMIGFGAAQEMRRRWFESHLEGYDVSYANESRRYLATALEIEINGEMYPAKVVGAPLYDPCGARMRG